MKTGMKILNSHYFVIEFHLSKQKLFAFKLLYGRRPKINTSQDFFTKMNVLVIANAEGMMQLHKEESEKISKIIKEANERYSQKIEKINKNRKDPNDKNINDVVLYRNRYKENKFDELTVPFTIINVKMGGTVKIKSVETGLVLSAARKDVKRIDVNLDIESYSPVVIQEGDLQSNAGRVLSENNKLVLNVYTNKTFDCLF